MYPLEQYWICPKVKFYMEIDHENQLSHLLLVCFHPQLITCFWQTSCGQHWGWHDGGRHQCLGCRGYAGWQSDCRYHCQWMESFRPHSLGRKRPSSGVPSWIPSAGETAGPLPGGGCCRVYHPEALAGSTTQDTQQEREWLEPTL